MTPEFRAAALALLIPCDVREESALLGWLAEQLTALSIADGDQPSWLRTELGRWREMGMPGDELRRLVALAIYDPGRARQSFTMPEIGRGNAGFEAERRTACERLSQRYFSLHARLQQLMLSPEEARLVLSYAGMVIGFAIDQRMSASEISRLLGARDRRLALNWRPVEAITRACDCAATFERPQMIAAFERSTVAEPALLADLSVEEATRYVGDLGVALGCEHNLAGALQELLLGTRHDPYLMILQFQLSTLEACDHAVTFAYEFKPRGQAADWLIGRYAEAGLAVAGNPYLNNAKALLRFDRSWAWGRDDYLAKAHALVDVLEEVETLGALPKAELGRYICALLRRVTRIAWERNHGGLPHPIPALATPDRTHLLHSLAARNTGTNGILEQRLVDAAVSARHPDWAPRGRGDSVFAASTFRRKLGDIEMIRLSPGRPRLIGYESHGGHLSASYVDGHVRTFAAVLRQRREELETAAPLANWQFESTFVSHSAERGLPVACALDVDGERFELQLGYQHFAGLANELAESDEAFFADFFAAPLNQFQVPASVREKALGFLPAG